MNKDSRINLRAYTANDESALVKMLVNEHEDLKNANRKNMTIAEYDGVVAGFFELFLPEGGDNFLQIFVAPEFRRRKIGTTLYNRAEKTLLEKGKNSFWNSFYNEQFKAFALYLGCDLMPGAAYMKYSGGLLEEPYREFIRPYEPRDFLACYWMWMRGMREMKRRAGYPESHCGEIAEPDEARRKEYDEQLATESYVLEVGGKVVAWGNSDDASIGCLAVEQSAQNKGYGTAMTIYLTNKILERSGKNEAYLYVEIGNDNARHVYEKVGYREVSKSFGAAKRIGTG